MNFFKDLYNSFNTDQAGFSSRKLSAFVGVVVAVYITIKYTTPEILDSILITWLLFVLLALGLVTFAQLAQFKTGQTITTSSETKTEKTETKQE